MKNILYLVGWVLCGFLVIALSMIMRKLRNRDMPWWDEGMKPMILTIMICAPFLLIIGIIQFVRQIPTYETKRRYVLRKFES